MRHPVARGSRSVRAQENQARVPRFREEARKFIRIVGGMCQAVPDNEQPHGLALTRFAR
jgi:hypothetical protein